MLGILLRPLLTTFEADERLCETLSVFTAVLAAKLIYSEGKALIALSMASHLLRRMLTRSVYPPLSSLRRTRWSCAMGKLYDQ